MDYELAFLAVLIFVFQAVIFYNMGKISAARGFRKEIVQLKEEVAIFLGGRIRE